MQGNISNSNYMSMHNSIFCLFVNMVNQVNLKQYFQLQEKVSVFFLLVVRFCLLLSYVFFYYDKVIFVVYCIIYNHIPHFQTVFKNCIVFYCINSHVQDFFFIMVAGISLLDFSSFVLHKYIG